MYVIIENDTPRKITYLQLRKENPQTSFPATPTPELLAGYNVYPVEYAEYPVYDQATQKVELGDITGSGTTWTQQYVVVALSQAQIDEKEQNAQDAADLNTVKADNAVMTIVNSNPAEIDTWMDTNVTDMASARNAMKHLAKAISVIGRKVLR